MKWAIIVVIIVGYTFWKFSIDSKEAQRRNISFGGMKKLFIKFVEYFEENGFELVEDTGTTLTYKKVLLVNSPFPKYLFLGVESKFKDFAFGYVINRDGKKYYSSNVEIRKNFSPEEVEMTVRKIIGDIDLSGHL